MKSILRSMLALAIMSTASFTSSASAEIVIIANPANPEASISAAEAKKIFLGKRTSFPGGAWAAPVDQAEGRATRDTFYQKAAGKDAAQMKAYWSKMIFSGKATPPEAVADDAAVKAWVAGNKDAIGYVDSGAVDGSVKVLMTLP